MFILIETIETSNAKKGKSELLRVIFLGWLFEEQVEEG